MASPAAVVRATRKVGGVFGTSSAQFFFCGLHPELRHPPYFRSADEKAHHLEMTHHALVWLRDEAEGGGYQYEADIPA